MKQKKKKERMKEDEQNRNFYFRFFASSNRTYRVDLDIEYQRDVICNLWQLSLPCFVFLGASPIPYVQVAILNLPNPYLTSTTILFDSKGMQSVTFLHSSALLLWSCYNTLFTGSCFEPTPSQLMKYLLLDHHRNSGFIEVIVHKNTPNFPCSFIYILLIVQICTVCYQTSWKLHDCGSE